MDAEHFLPIWLSLYDRDGELYAPYEYQRLRVNPSLGAEAFRLAPALDAPPPARAHESTSPEWILWRPVWAC